MTCFINRLVVSGLRVVSDFATPSFPYCFLSCYILCVSLLFLLFLLYESSSYFVLVFGLIELFFLDFSSWKENSKVFLTIQAFAWITSGLIGLFFCRFFIKNEDFWGFSYYSGLSFCIKCGGARQVIYIDARTIVESLGTFRKLSRRCLASLEFILVVWIYLGHDLGVQPGWVLGLVKDPRFRVC